MDKEKIDSPQQKNKKDTNKKRIKRGSPDDPGMKSVGQEGILTEDKGWRESV